MNKRLYAALFGPLFALIVVGASASASDPAPGSLLPGLNLAIMNAIPPPADDPLLDSNGNPVLDATGKPVSDPNEGFHAVIPHVFDPAHTLLVESNWLDGTGCPTNANVATYPATSPTTTYTDPACPATAADLQDTRNMGLLLVKTGPTENNASAVAELKKVRGLTLHELGYDIRKHGGSASMLGSHCGAGAPRFNVTTSDAFFFIGCSSPPPDAQVTGDGWTRLRWGTVTPLSGFCIPTGPTSTCPADFAFIPVTGTVQRIEIVFDEGTDAFGGPDQFGAALLDNIDVNGTLVGRGPNGG